jgi:hypothetical protein
MNSAITLMTSHNTEGLNPLVDYPAILTMNAAITLMTSHNTEGLIHVRLGRIGFVLFKLDSDH